MSPTDRDPTTQYFRIFEVIGDYGTTAPRHRGIILTSLKRLSKCKVDRHPSGDFGVAEYRASVIRNDGHIISFRVYKRSDATLSTLASLWLDIGVR
jgi:hypothetical protein